VQNSGLPGALRAAQELDADRDARAPPPGERAGRYVYRSGPPGPASGRPSLLRRPVAADGGGGGEDEVVLDDAAIASDAAHLSRRLGFPITGERPAGGRPTAGAGAARRAARAAAAWG
jgi:hypothetical protein